jgi:cysteine desulfurase
LRHIYLDHNATTPLAPEAAAAVSEALREGFGNPSSLHWYGQAARAAIDDARGEVAALIGATPQEIVFTSSGTEADNLALRGVAWAARPPRRKVVYAAIEHHAVLHTARALAEEGWPVETARALPDGRVDMEDLERRVDSETALVAVMLANNETGVVQPIDAVVALARRHGALVLCDAVQAAGKLQLDVARLGVDLLALSAHKIYGPKGVGALFVKRGTRMKALLRGGAQEKGRRAGTENVPGIVGFGQAALVARLGLEEEAVRVGALRDRLEARLLELPGAERNGEPPRVANTTNVSFAGADAESLLMALDLMGVAVSTGAACAAGAVEPSHVLRAMRLSPRRVQASIRLSLGRGTTAEEVDLAVEAVATALERQRALAR